MNRFITLLLWMLLLPVAFTLHADDQIASPVSIRISQIPNAEADILRVEVTNISKYTVIVDRNEFLETNFQASTKATIGKDGTLSSLHTGSVFDVAGGHWTVDQLRHREPERVVSILPQHKFTMDVDANILLQHLDPKFPRGKIDVRFAFHDFVLSVDGNAPTEAMFHTAVETNQVELTLHPVQ